MWDCQPAPLRQDLIRRLAEQWGETRRDEWGERRGSQLVERPILVLHCTYQVFRHYPFQHLSAMASLQQTEAINVAAADGGLAQVFAEKNVDKLIVDLFKTESILILEDFASSFTADKWNTEAENFCDKVESLKGKTVQVARLRNAVILARAVINSPPPEKETASLNADFEAPLDAVQKDQVAKSWTTRCTGSCSPCTSARRTRWSTGCSGSFGATRRASSWSAR